MFARLFFLFRSTGIITYCITVMVITAYSESTSRYAAPLRLATDALAQGEYDSSIIYFVKAFSNGMPRDSLFYFWSEVLLHKGVLDSALAANLMVPGTASGGLGVKVLQQRVLIYRCLGWNREAALVLDTIRASPEYRQVRLIPDITVGVMAGYGAVKHATDTSKPWGAGLGSAFSEKERGPFGRIDLRTVWRLIDRSYQLSSGLTGVVMHRQYNSEGTIHAADSTDITGSVFTTISGLSFSSTYALSLQRRIDDSLFISNSIEGGFTGGGRLQPLLWGGGTVALTTKGNWSNSRAWFFASVQSDVGTRLKLDGNLFVNAYFEHPSTFGFDLANAGILFVEDGGLQYPIFYTDDSYTEIIDTSLLRVITGMLRSNIIASSRDTVLYVGLKQPFSGLSVSPRLSMTIKSKLPVQLGVSWKWHWFPERYEWDQIKTFARYILYSKTGEQVYVVPEDLLTSDLTITRGTDRGLALYPAALQGAPVVHYRMQRIDNTVAADITLQLYTGRFGTGALRCTASKTWSTLLRKAPIEIPEWNVTASLEWRFKKLSRSL